jgi:hypothetical protein
VITPLASNAHHYRSVAAEQTTCNRRNSFHFSIGMVNSRLHAITIRLQQVHDTFKIGRCSAGILSQLSLTITQLDEARGLLTAASGDEPEPPLDLVIPPDILSITDACSSKAYR